MRNIFKLSLLALAGLGGATAGATSFENDVPSLVVRYSEQSLMTDEGVHALYHRLVRASEQVCPDADRNNLSKQAIAKECRQEALARAVQQIQNPRLAALHAVTRKSG